MNRSYSKLRHIQESNIILEQRRLDAHKSRTSNQYLMEEGYGDRYFFCETGHKGELSKDEAIIRWRKVYVSNRSCDIDSRSAIGSTSPQGRVRHGSIRVHTVESGENLTNIIKKYTSNPSVTPEIVAKINDIPDMNKINVGQKIIIPRTWYKIKNPSL